jgi:hypothetical protein
MSTCNINSEITRTECSAPNHFYGKAILLELKELGFSLSLDEKKAIEQADIRTDSVERLALSRHYYNIRIRLSDRSMLLTTSDHVPYRPFRSGYTMMYSFYKVGLPI